MKKILLILIILAVAFNHFSIYSNARSAVGQAIENFTEDSKRKIENASNVLSGKQLNISNSRNKIIIFENIRKKIEARKGVLESQKEIVLKRIYSLQKTIKKLDEDINILKTKINTTNENIMATNNNIIKTKKEIIVLKEKLAENKEVLINYVVYIYKKDNEIYTDNKIDILKTLLLNEKSLWDVFAEQNFSKILEITGQRILGERKKILRNLFVAQIKLNQKLSKLKTLKRNIVISKWMLQDKKSFKQELLYTSKWKESIYTKLISEKIESEQNMKKFILKEKIKFNNIKRSLFKEYGCRFIDLNEKPVSSLIWMKQKCINLNKIIYAEKKLQTYYKKWFDWPVPPNRWVSAYFKDPWYLRVIGWNHYATDIRAYQWTEIKAPADWYVVYLKAPAHKSYAYLAVKHANWFVSVYWHISKSLVKQYDYVKSGQTIALTWWAIWTKWAWLLTSWPHLHFEVIKSGEHVDGLKYLDLSFLSQKNIPASKYINEYMKDYKTRYWREVENKQELFDMKWFNLKWNTEVDRQKFLLNKYAWKSFKNWNIWVEEALEAEIDPSFLMCVWLAESSLGRNLTTWYNVWNVWNTDSWGRWTFSSPREWINWMVKTFNNKYLWKYTKISQLSRYWNNDPKKQIYASSWINWHTNIIKCMWELKQDYLKDDFEFRIKMK